MTTVTRKEQKKARLRFIALYAISLLFIFIVVSAFWQNKEGAQADPIDKEVAESNLFFMQTDTLLHARMEQLDKAFSSFLLSRTKNNNVDAGRFLQAKNSFTTVLDSIEKQAMYLSNGPKKNAMTNLAAKFRMAFIERNKILDAVALLPKQKRDSNLVANNNTGRSQAELEELKKILLDKENKIAELERRTQVMQPGNDKGLTDLLNQKQKELAGKDKVITFLESQLKQVHAKKGPAILTSSNSSDGEWKKKYASLKESYDKITASEKSLKSAYKTVADDNRRLLNQLQAARKN